MQFTQLSSRTLRIITALVLLAILITALSLQGWYLRGLVLVAALLGLYEFYELVWPGANRLMLKGFGLAAGVGVIISGAFLPEGPALVLCLLFVAAASSFLRAYGLGDREARLRDFAPMIMGVVYVPFILSLAFFLSAGEQLLVMGAAILTDTGGYCAGTLWGCHKMWPSVSPLKSWQGAAGGLALCVAFCLSAGLAGPARGWELPMAPWWCWLLTGVALNAAAQAGDFFESALKRSLNKKDSGALLPGHGGLLDRLDSVLFVVPVYVLLRILLNAAGA